MERNDRVTLKPSYGSSFWTLNHHLIQVDHGDHLVVKAKIDRSGQGTRLLVGLLDAQGKERHHFETWPSWLEPVFLMDRHPQSGKALSDLGLNLPISIQTWRDWIDFRNLLDRIFNHQDEIRSNWIAVDYQVKYRWIEKPSFKKGVKPDYESVVIPFQITGLEFHASSFQRSHPKCKLSRSIYLLLGINGESIENKLLWV